MEISDERELDLKSHDSCAAPGFDVMSQGCEKNKRDVTCIEMHSQLGLSCALITSLTHSMQLKGKCTV